MNEALNLLAAPFAACLLMTLMLGYMGLHVLKRDVIFVDIALAQFAAVGAIAAHFMLGVHADSPAALALAWGATIIASAFYTLTRHFVPQIRLEAVIGISYAAAASAAMFLIAKGSSGHTHIQQMLAGNLLWVQWKDIALSSAVFALAGLIFWICRRPLHRISDNYETAARRGFDMMAWDFVFYALCGAVITVAVRMTGVLVVFCYLIIPATVSALFASAWFHRLLIVAATGAVASVAGLTFAYTLDFSAGGSVSLFLGLAVAGSALVAHARRRY
ncbi:MAG: iron chelate uptake ABC transporter family permease subunit [Kiritimatiellia bacterium]|jgi:zinc/manganese transport system permease protein